MSSKTFNMQAAQGDILIRRVSKVPEEYVAQKEPQGGHIVAHSETGHHHVVEAAPGSTATLYRKAGQETVESSMVSYLEVAGEVANLVHKRPWDTHETLALAEGTWEIRRQREHTPTGWRQVQD